jgi:GNAT superfamily N-acetyltransferase
VATQRIKSAGTPAIIIAVSENAPAIRAAQPADRDRVWPLAHDFATSFEPERASFDASFDALLAAPHTVVLVAETPELGIVGYLLVNSHLTFLANGPVAWVEEIMVDQRVRRNGVGRALMAAAEDWSRAINAAYVALASRRARDFYLALGYEDSAVFYKKTLNATLNA